ncbi:glycerol-3-phosphate acyltransferase [Chloroflexota bacterium]
MTIWFVLLTINAYLLGSVPASYLAAKLFRGFDLRQYGTGQVGGGNLWRMTSWKLGLPVGLFDLCKGMVMVWAAQAAGLSVAQQLVIGSAAIIGHNWPVFLRFSGGRGIGTTIGVVLIIPLINNIAPWTSVAFFAILLIGSIALRSSPLPALAAVVALPSVSWGVQETLPVILAYLAILAIIIIKRLTVPSSPDTTTMGKGQLILNRLLFDRDIKDKKAWMYRKPIKQKED